MPSSLYPLLSMLSVFAIPAAAALLKVCCSGHLLVAQKLVTTSPKE